MKYARHRITALLVGLGVAASVADWTRDLGAPDWVVGLVLLLGLIVFPGLLGDLWMAGYREGYRQAVDDESGL